ncbi:hypothetical protein BCR42DRAFT_490963 [Absidia repens]|uniref:Uncharacterized protein n=1 Tax=Absidia repens TaxID=90262 RepID=A0A1X2II59_9FUNG|nr:hypothetical protein BCR42DRAFT_490963 [Absidia repens]
MENLSESLFYVCEDEKCHCDFRLSIKNCYEEERMRIVYYLTLGITFIVICFGLFLLFKRIWIQGHRFVDRRTSKGCLRPQPVDCLALFCTIFNILRFIDDLLLVTDTASHPIVRVFLWEMSWELIYVGFILYVLGVFQTLRDSHQAVSKGWLPSAKALDISVIALLVSMAVTNLTCTFSAGAFSNTKPSIARNFTHGLYYCWFAYCTILAVTILYCGARLIRILESHLQNYNMPRHRVNNIKNGIFKIKVMVFIGFFGGLIYGISMLMFAILRSKILTTPGGGLTLSIIWNILGAVCTGVMELSILMSVAAPDLGKDIGLKGSSDDNGRATISTDNNNGNANDKYTYNDTNIVTDDEAFREPWKMRPASLHDAERLQLEYQNAIQHLNQYSPSNIPTKSTI